MHSNLERLLIMLKAVFVIGTMSEQRKTIGTTYINMDITHYII